jgi:tight adherence protein B
MDWLIAVRLFVGIICIVEGLLLLTRHKWDPESKTAGKRLARLVGNKPAHITGILKKRTFSSVPYLHTLLEKIPVMHRLDRLVIAADSRVPVGVFMLTSCVLSLSVYFFLAAAMRSSIIPAMAALLMATAPFVYLLLKKRERIAKFQRQFPDALDLMARSLRAGHAFSGGLNMVAREFDDPVGPEFRQVVHEINFGSSIDQALRNMIDRIDVPDLKFFTVSVVVQKESGGNLADILESIAGLTRERFKLAGKIKALSAEGKLTAIILAALPFVIMLALSIVNPGYLPEMLDDPAGKVFVTVAAVMMAIGIAVIKKIVNIRI